MEEQLDELEEQLREQRLEDLIVEQERREASEAMQEQLEAMTTDGRYGPSPPPQEGRRQRKKETFAELRERLENEQQAQEQLEAMTTDGYCVSPSPLEDLSPTRS